MFTPCAHCGNLTTTENLKCKTCGGYKPSTCIKDYEVEIDRLRAELAETKIALEAPTKFEIELRNDLSTARAENEALRKELEFTKANVAMEAATADTLRKRIAVLDAAFVKVTDRAEQYQNRVSDLNDEIEALRKRVGELEAALELHRRARADQADTEIRRLRNRAEQTEAVVEGQMRHYNLLLSKAEAQLAPYLAALNNAETLVAAERARAEQAEAQLAEAKAELAGAKSLLVDKTYIQCKADYNRGHLSHANYLNERERAALAPPPAGREG